MLKTSDKNKTACAVTVAIVVLSSAYCVALPASYATRDRFAEPRVSPQSIRAVPAATRACSPEVSSWWEQLMHTGREAAEAQARKEETISRAVQYLRSRGKRVPDDDRKLIPEKELARLDESITTSRESLKTLLHKGAEARYPPPIEDQSPFLLYFAQPRYTEEARRNKIAGVVKTRVLFQPDGTVGRVTIIKGLGHGLDERALEAVYRLVFLPAVKEGSFVAFWQAVDVEFLLR